VYQIVPGNPEADPLANNVPILLVGAWGHAVEGQPKVVGGVARLVRREATIRRRGETPLGHATVKVRAQFPLLLPGAKPRRDGHRDSEVIGPRESHLGALSYGGIEAPQLAGHPYPRSRYSSPKKLTSIATFTTEDVTASAAAAVVSFE